MIRNLYFGLFASSMLVLGACSHHGTTASTTETAATEAHQCSAECKDKSCTHDGKKCDNKSCEKCKDKSHAAGETACDMHASHDHKHGKGCGHKTVKHGDHADYMHDGHQHAVHGDHVDEHKAAKASKTATETNS